MKNAVSLDYAMYWNKKGILVISWKNLRTKYNLFISKIENSF